MRHEVIQPTAERLRKDDWHEIRTERAGVTTLQVSTPDALDRYWKRGLLDPARPGENARRYDAGCRLREAWNASGLEARLIGSYTPTVSGGANDDTRMVEALAGSRAYTRMIGLVGRDWGPVFIACCLGEPVGAGGQMNRLRNGLARLADALRVR